MAKYNFWVRTAEQTNHPMKGIEMEFGECRQAFNDYLALLEKHGVEVIDAEIYRIQYEKEDDDDKQMTPTDYALSVIKIETEDTPDCTFTFESLLKYEGIDVETLPSILKKLERFDCIAKTEGGYIYKSGIVKPVIR